MKKLMLSLGMLVTTIAFGVTAQAGTFPVTKVIEVPGATKEQIVEKVSAWTGSYAQDSKVDAKGGVVTAKGMIVYPSPPVDRIQYVITYDMKSTVKGNKNTVTFDNVMLKSPTTYQSDTGEKIAGSTMPVKSAADIAAATSRLTYVANNLEAYLLGKGTEASPLMKCPACPVLGTSPEEVKEHEKMHEHHTK